MINFVITYTVPLRFYAPPLRSGGRIDFPKRPYRKSVQRSEAALSYERPYRFTCFGLKVETSVKFVNFWIRRFSPMALKLSVLILDRVGRTGRP